MLTATEETINALTSVLQETTVGTNLNLLRLMWSMMNGSFLKSRGAIHGALSESGFSDDEIQRGWSGFRYGSWEIDKLLSCWHEEVEAQKKWQAKKLDGYRVRSIDITGFWRPKLKGEVNRLYNSTANRALPAMIFGVTISSGEIDGKRVPLLESIERCKVGIKEKEFRKILLQSAKKSVQADEVAVVDAGFKINEMIETGIERFVLREATNCTARKNELPESKGRGRPLEYGVKVRPLPRRYNGKVTPATNAEEDGTFLYSGRRISYSAWHNLVSSKTKVDKENHTYSIYVFHDPAYNKPMVLATVMPVNAEINYLFYRERWPVEHPPLASKQMIGLHRQFVHADEACFRLPELGLLTGNILSLLAASLPPFPTGYWDREPKATPGRLRRVLSKAIFPTLDQLDPSFRKKASIVAHLTRGPMVQPQILAHT